MTRAMCRQPEHFVARNVVAAEVLDGGVRAYRKILWRARERCGDLDGPSPSLVLAQGQLCDLTQLRALPLSRELHRRFVQTCGPLPRAIHLEQPSVTEVEVGPHRLRL